MEAEELDYIFRAKLDVLVQVPDLEWSDTGVWNKVATNIKPRWYKWWGWGMGAIVMIFVGLVLSLRSTSDKSVLKSYRPVRYCEFNKIDKSCALLVLKKRPNRRLFKAVLAQERLDTLPLNLVPKDTIHLQKEIKDIVMPMPSSRAFPQMRLPYGFKNWGHQKPVWWLHMSQQPVLRLTVNNSLNLYNLGKLIDITKAQGINYRYTYKYNPNPFENTIMPFSKRNDPTIILNDYHNSLR